MNTEIWTVRTDEFEMRYFRFGAEGRRVFVILPGLSIKSVMEAADAVVNAYQKMAADFDVYLFDRRTEVPESYSIYDMADDTAAAFRELGLNDVDLFGVSQGGMIAQVMAIRYPELVHKLVLGSTSSRASATQNDSLSDWISHAEEGDPGLLIESFAEKVYSPDFYAKYKDLILASFGEITREELSKFRILAGSAAGFDVYDELDKIRCPILVLGAGNDEVLGVQPSIDIAEKTGCELYIFEGYGHAAYDEAPDYLDKVYGFLIK